MLIETLTNAAGRFNFRPGEQLELPTKEANELIEAGAAKEVKKGDGETAKATKDNSGK